MKTIKIIGCVLLLFAGDVTFSQEGFNTGANVSTSFQLMSHRNKGTGIWSSESGYGFAAGVPFRFGYADKRAFVTGINYEYMSFDDWINGNLVYSMRFHSLHVPLQLNFNLISSWFLSAGTGVNYTFRSRVFTPGNNIDISNSANPFQPYLSLGVGSLSNRGNGLFELGLQARYHFLDNWKKNTTLYPVTSSKVISLDLILRFYF